MKDSQNIHNKQKKSFKEKFISYYKKHKKKVWILGIALVLIIIIIITNIIKSIQHSIQVEAEEKRSFFINTQEDVTVDCHLKETFDSNLSCEKATLTGNYSDYETTNLRSSTYGVQTNNGSFTAPVYHSVSKTLYEKDDFDISSIKDEETAHPTKIYLYNNVLEREVASKNITTHFKFSEQDKALILKKHQDWKQWKAEEDKKKAQQEAEAANKKKQQEAEAAAKKAEQDRAQQQQNAEAEAKVKQEMPQDKLVEALDTCGDVLYAQTRIRMTSSIKYVQNSYWSGEDYQQMLNLIDSKNKVHVVCKYNWQNNSATITSWNYL